MLTPYVPFPPASGGQIRTLNLIKSLSKDHEIILVALYKDEEQKKYGEDLKPYCKEIYLCKRAKKPWQVKNVLKAIFTKWPFLIVRNYSEEARNVVDTILNEQTIDVIHAETFYVMPHVPQTKVPTLLVDQTIEYKVYQHYVETLIKPLAFALNLDIIKLKFWERYYWRKADAVVLVSEADERIVNTLEPSVKTELVPNGAGEDMLVETPTKRDLIKPKLLFVGNFLWLQNTEAAEFLIKQIYPLIKKAIPHATVIVAGQHAQEKLGALAENHVKIIDIPYDDKVTMIDLYKTSTLFISPIYGAGGTRLKILAAMASGLPIVGTKISLEGLATKEDVHAVIAETPSEFVAGVKELLHNEAKYYELQKAAHALVMQTYSYSAISKKLVDVYKSIKNNSR
jgi:polysaccharide biosynthesis protein PslH